MGEPIVSLFVGLRGVVVVGHNLLVDSSKVG